MVKNVVIVTGQIEILKFHDIKTKKMSENQSLKRKNSYQILEQKSLKMTGSEVRTLSNLLAMI